MTTPKMIPQVIHSIDHLKERQLCPNYLTRQNFKHWLQSTHTTQKHVAEETGISATMLSYYVNGYKNSHDLAEPLAEYVNQHSTLASHQFIVPDYIKYVTVSDPTFKRPRCADARTMSVYTGCAELGVHYLWKLIYPKAEYVPLIGALIMHTGDDDLGEPLGACIGTYTSAMYASGIPAFTDAIPVDFVLADSRYVTISDYRQRTDTTLILFITTSGDDTKVRSLWDDFLYNRDTLTGLNLYFTKKD